MKGELELFALFCYSNSYISYVAFLFQIFNDLMMTFLSLLFLLFPLHSQYFRWDIYHSFRFHMSFPMSFSDWFTAPYAFLFGLVLFLQVDASIRFSSVL